MDSGRAQGELEAGIIDRRAVYRRSDQSVAFSSAASAKPLR